MRRATATWAVPAGLSVLAALQLLTLRGLVRRVEGLESRIQTGLPVGAGATLAGAAPATAVRTGDRVPSLTVSTDSGEFATGGRVGRTLYGFFSPACDACHAQLAPFAAAARHADVDTLAVVVDDGGDTAAMALALAPSPVAVARFHDEVVTTFGVDSFPSFLLTDVGGVVESVRYEVPGLP